MNTTPYCAALSFFCSLLSIEAAQIQSTSRDSDAIAIVRTADARKLRSRLDHGLSPDARDTDGNTLLMHAAVYGDLSCMRLLLNRGADVNASNGAGATALMRAAFDYDKVRLLVDY